MNKVLKIKLIKKFLPWALGIIYVISPIDIIPDIIGGLGWLDDISVMGILLWWHYYIRPQGKKSSQEKEKEGREFKQESNREKSKGKSGTDKSEEPEIETDPYKILGIESSASGEEIKSAYTKLAAKYHPDKVQHLGKELQELAHKKFISIQGAYDAVKK